MEGRLHGVQAVMVEKTLQLAQKSLALIKSSATLPHT
jgi:hypothetical protein